MAIYIGTSTDGSTAYAPITGTYIAYSDAYVGVRNREIYRAYFLLKPPSSANISDDYTKISKITLKYTLNGMATMDNDVQVKIGVLNSFDSVK